MPSLQQEIKKSSPFDLAEEEAYLNIRRTASILCNNFDRLFKSHRLSEATYNVLRILRGVERQAKNTPPSNNHTGLPCLEIAARLITRVPDITRLIDRLEKLRLVKRHRHAHDRRVILVQITPKGLDLLARLDAPVLELHHQLLGHLAPADLQTLNQLLAKARNNSTS